MQEFPTVTDPFEIEQFFKIFKRDEEKILLWQSNASKNIIHYGILKKHDGLKQQVEFRPYEASSFSFERQEDIFFYSEKHHVASKLEIKVFDSMAISFQLPSILRIIKEDVFQAMKVIEIENETENLHKRNAPRKEAKGGQLAAIKKENGDIKFVQMHDMSTGGVGLLVDDPGLFIKDEIIFVTHINSKELPKPIKGKVVAVRKMSEGGYAFKIGIQFI